MCGIAGYINQIKNYDKNQNINLLKKFCKLLNHRGPDSNGIWFDTNNRIFFSHTRLSINDLSINGSQPMISSSQEQVIIFNGEIYNHLLIREKILRNFNIDWKSNSDTETLLQTINFLGIEESLKIFEGMFSFCLFDKKNKKIFLARDKFGEKPLYYGVIDNNFVFGSELKIFNNFPNFKKKISKRALETFLKYSYVPEPLSIYENIFKLNAGEILELELNKINFESPKYFENLKRSKWYNSEVCDANDINNKNSLNDLDEILNESVRESLTSDVEVGSFLSGGIDSSLISSIAQKQSRKKIKTFSICFDDEEYNEQAYSKLVSKHIQSDHKEFIVTSNEMFEYYEKISDIYDEPFADSSQIPTSILSKFASQNVKVCLTGDGADELFGGYNRYIFINKVNSMTKYLPNTLKKGLSNFILNLDHEKMFFIGKLLNQFIFPKKFAQLDDKIQKLGIILKDTSNPFNMYLKLIEVMSNNREPVYNNLDANNEFLIKKYQNFENTNNFNPIEMMMKMDQNIYLTGDILHKVDRASMFYSLETRVPFLNSKVVNFSSNLAFNLKINNGNGKYILKEIAKKYLPKKIINRNKMGFSVPLKNWILKNSDEFNYKIDNKREVFENLGFNYNSIKKHLEEHKAKKKNWSHIIWNLIIFERWVDKYIT